MRAQAPRPRVPMTGEQFTDWLNCWADIEKRPRRHVWDYRDGYTDALLDVNREWEAMLGRVDRESPA